MAIRKFSKEDSTKFEAVEEVIFAGNMLDTNEFLRLSGEEGFCGLFDGDEYLGYFLARAFGPLGRIHRIGVSPSHIRKGYGSILLEKALEYLRTNNSMIAELYVESQNYAAIGLYHKFGFTKIFDSWHYIIPRSKFDYRTLSPQYQLKALGVEDIVELVSIFPHLNGEQLEDWMTSQRGKERELQFLALYFNDEAVVFARFATTYSGCMPFEYTDIRHVDAFIQRLFEDFVLEEKDHIRITFDRYGELAEKFDTRGYTKHQHLHKMRLELT